MEIYMTHEYFVFWSLFFATFSACVLSVYLWHDRDKNLGGKALRTANEVIMQIKSLANKHGNLDCLFLESEKAQITINENQADKISKLEKKIEWLEVKLQNQPHNFNVSIPAIKMIHVQKQARPVVNNSKLIAKVKKQVRELS
jgi:hypothetical protein